MSFDDGCCDEHADAEGAEAFTVCSFDRYELWCCPLLGAGAKRKEHRHPGRRADGIHSLPVCFSLDGIHPPPVVVSSADWSRLTVLVIPFTAGFPLGNAWG